MSVYNNGAKTGPNYPPGTGNVDEITTDIIKQVRAYFKPADVERLIHTLDDVWKEMETAIIERDVNNRRSEMVKNE